MWCVPYRTEESVELVCSSQNRRIFAHHYQKEDIPGRVLVVEYQKIEYVGRVPGRIPAIDLIGTSLKITLYPTYVEFKTGTLLLVRHIIIETLKSVPGHFSVPQAKKVCRGTKKIGLAHALRRRCSGTQNTGGR